MRIIFVDKFIAIVQQASQLTFGCILGVSIAMLCPQSKLLRLDSDDTALKVQQGHRIFNYTYIN